MLILDLHVVQGANPADNIIVHSDHAGLQTAAELHIRLTLAQKQHICGIASDIHQEQTQVVLQLTLLGCNSSEGLRVDKHITDHNGDWLVVIDELNGLVALEVVPELILQQAVMLRGQANCQIDLFCRRQRTCIGQLLGNGKQRQNEEAFVPGLVPAVRKPLAGQSPELSVVLQNLICHRRPHGVLCQTGDEVEVDALASMVTVVNCD